MKNVFVGMSGGVDSSVAAALLKEQGYNVTGIYMKNWTLDLPGMKCPWQDDFLDAKRVAVQLGIDFKVYDFQKQYKQKVVDYMLGEFKAGRTPNPDIMCNQEIKFKLFAEAAFDDGADLIATGHYAQTKDGRLLMAKDSNKDQTYFLYRVSSKVLSKTIFPLGELTKPEVRALAKKFKLATAEKGESMGICFVGKVPIKEFLENYVSQKPGDIISQNGKVIGQHDGAIFYTIGQRHGLEVGGGLPFYVTGKSMKKNEIYVTTDLQDEKLWSSQIKLSDLHWINEPPKPSQKLMVRIRHRAKLVPVKSLAPLQIPSGTVGNRIAKRRDFAAGFNSFWKAELGEEVRALTPGQSAVFYSGLECLGGGIVTA